MAGAKLGSFDGEDPAAFYLGPLQSELEATADTTLVVEGARLPAHSQVLQCNSRVMSAMFADLWPASRRARCHAGDEEAQSSGGGTTEDTSVQEAAAQAAAVMDREEAPAAAASSSRNTLRNSKKRKWADQQDGQLALEAPFQGFTQHQVALFLRLVYNQEWREAVPDTLGALHDSLPALLRLAHRLDAPGLLGTLTKYMADATLTTLTQLSMWLKAAADCQLEELRLGLLSRLARRLAAKKERLPNSVALLADLEWLDARTLRQLVAIMAAAGEPPSETSLVRAVDLAANIGNAEWMLTHFSKQPCGPDECVYSPWFDLGGHQWRLAVFPGGVEGSPKHLSMFLHCATRGVRADYEVAILDESMAVQEVGTDANVFESSWGFSRFIRLSALRRRGLLAGDCLRLRLTITVLPSLPAAVS